MRAQRSWEQYAPGTRAKRWLSDVEGLSHADIAELAQVPVETASSRERGTEPPAPR